MLAKVTGVRHAAVAVSIGATSVLAGVGIIGGGSHPERFDAKTVVIAREGDDRVQVTEYVDIDFGTGQRRGYQRVIPNDFGVPTDVVASTPDADPTLSVVDQGSTTRIRIGDPDITFTGQHRYVLVYSYPEPRLDELGLIVDVVAAGTDNETGRFEVIVTGFELTDLRCDVGRGGVEGGCELTPAGDGTYRTVLEPLEEGDGLTVGGTVVAFADVVDIEPPPIPERRGDGVNGWLLAAGFALLGVVGAVPVYLWSRTRGRNEVYAGGAADAAYGSLPPPGSEAGSPPTMLVADDDMADLATTEFAPPKGIDPWEARVLLAERCDNDAVEAWLSGMVGREAVDAAEEGKNLSLSSGSKRGELARDDAVLLDRILGISDPYVTGEYDEKFARAWKAIHKEQVRRIGKSNWWNHMPPGNRMEIGSGSPFAFLMIFVFVFVWGGWTASAFAGVLKSWPIAIAVGVLFPAFVAYFMYRALLPARSAQGSALALQAESFRRFLHASEGHHVEWAWSNGLLREYSAWAVALDEADAWSKALDRANVPAPARAATAPIIIHHTASSMRSARTAPSSSGGGGGGFGGGGVGGGGGGGSSGSW